MHPELIVCAAIKFIERTQKEIDLNRKGTEFIVPMVRHYSPDGQDVLDSLYPIYENKELEEIEQGFLTNKSRFVNRKEALAIAKANNQIKFDIGYEPDELYSEMLY
ncbi:hypothetical protein ACIRXL_02895 [Avibacterium paragallinarum]|uniref:Uncharacterized protein n=1 Tax=Avibacterium paragallinarum TaxID=728 RepID=A0A380X6K7_AVIPA|nr:hypothetical protein [Avibacterium paragallinarum]POY45801.1 hypothetical protein C3364_10865 [Avibacterium paragallinarum]RZN78191.1 hypothetical protein EC523_00785 [Avibacterium paragallinarum]TID29130.1 hypothetical protein JO83_00875 [Avibacterium paragallinarum]CDF98294.1 Putative Uncharacterized protein [Avibacterium paragallinarum JF4211]STO72662.1 Uncharacterised protein [Avibacterium paragallinarum]